MSEEQVEAIFQHACEGAAESIGSTRVDWQRVVDAIRFLRRERDDACRLLLQAQNAAIDISAQLTEARRLLDDAREPKPVGETCFDAQGIRWYNTSDRERLPFGTKLYAATQPADAALADALEAASNRCHVQDVAALRKAAAALRARPQAVAEAVPQCFVEYMAKNYPPNTLIADGAWHARPIWNAARSAMLAASQSATDTEGRKDV